MGKFTKMAVPGFAALAVMASGASADILIDDFSNGTNENQLGHYWYYYTNLGKKGGAGNQLIDEWNNGTLVKKDYGSNDESLCWPMTERWETIDLPSNQVSGVLGQESYDLLFKPTLSGGVTGANTGVLRFSKLPASSWQTTDPCYSGVAIGTNLTKAPSMTQPIGPNNPAQLPVNEMFNGVTHIKFRAKVNLPGMLSGAVKFKVETEDQLNDIPDGSATTKKLSNAPYFAPLTFDAVNQWKEFSIDVTGPCKYTVLTLPPGTETAAGAIPWANRCVGDLIRDNWESSNTHLFTFDIKDAVKIAWFINGQDWALPAGDVGELVIDWVATEGGNYEVPGKCPTCKEDAIKPSSGVWLLSNFDNVLFTPASGYGYESQNRLGGPWYAFNDFENAGNDESKITSGRWYDPQYLVDSNGERCEPLNPPLCKQGGLGLNIAGVYPGQSVNGIEVTPEMIDGEYMEGKPGHSSSNGAFISFDIGKGWIDSDGLAIRGFAGIGTKLTEKDTEFFDANAGVTDELGLDDNIGRVDGIWFMYRTTGISGNLVVSVVDANALAQGSKAADATYSVKINGTGGQWAAARITWDKFAVPLWSNWSTPLDLTRLAEIQFRYEGLEGNSGAITIDEVYLFNKDLISPPSGVKLSRSGKAAAPALRASYSRGGVNVNWSASSKISSGKISLVNIKGVTVASQPVKASGSKIAAKLSAKGALPAGMYFVRIDAKDVNGKRIVQQAPVNIVK